MLAVELRRGAPTRDLSDYEERIFRMGQRCRRPTPRPRPRCDAGWHLHHGARRGGRRVPRRVAARSPSASSSAGTAAWLGAKAIKPYGGRERPSGVLGDGVHLREGIEGDLGWVSGHTAVATTLALVLADDLPGWTARSSPRSWPRPASAGCTSARTCPMTSSAAPGSALLIAGLDARRRPAR